MIAPRLFLFAVGPTKKRVLGGRSCDQLQRYDESADNSPWINALAELRQRATREGHCYQHVQAITVAIDQYAERRWATAITFSTSPTVWDQAPTKCGDTSRRDAAGN